MLNSRKVVGWSIDSQQASSLVTNALSMAISNRTPAAGAVIHSDHGSQFSSWAFSERVRQAGLAPSMGTVGDAFDNAMIESFWARLQTELLDRKKWKTRRNRSAGRVGAVRRAVIFWSFEEGPGVVRRMWGCGAC